MIDMNQLKRGDIVKTIEFIDLYGNLFSSTKISIKRISKIAKYGGVSVPYNIKFANKTEWWFMDNGKAYRDKTTIIEEILEIL